MVVLALGVSMTGEAEQCRPRAEGPAARCPQADRKPGAPEGYELADPAGMCESFLGGRGCGVRGIEVAAESVEVLGRVAHSLTEVVAIEARFLGLQDCCVNVTGVAVRGRDGRQAGPVQREIRNRGCGEFGRGGTGSGDRLGGGRCARRSVGHDRLEISGTELACQT